MKNQRYLTKSRFKLGTECPTKLYYTKKQEYQNQKLDDKFLVAPLDRSRKVDSMLGIIVHIFVGFYCQEPSVFASYYKSLQYS